MRELYLLKQLYLCTGYLRTLSTWYLRITRRPKLQVMAMLILSYLSPCLRGCLQRKEITSLRCKQPRKQNCRGLIVEAFEASTMRGRDKSRKANVALYIPPMWPIVVPTIIWSITSAEFGSYSTPDAATAGHLIRLNADMHRGCE